MSQIRVTGLNSGLDTESLVQALVSGYSYKKTKYVKAQTKLSWKQDAWKSLNTEIYSFYSTSLSNMRFSSAYNSKKASSSDSTKASISASSNAVVGTHTLDIINTAKTGYLTGSKLDSSINENSTLSDLGYTGSTTELTVKIGGEEKKIALYASNKVSDVVASLKNLGLNASYDSTNNRFFINSKESGEAANFELSSDSLEGNKLLSKLGLLYGVDDDTKAWSAYTDDELEDMVTAAIATDNTLDHDELLESYKARRDEAKQKADLVNEDAAKIDGEDAKIVLDNATYTSSTNAFSVNGLTVEATDVTTSTLKINVGLDTDKIYDSIKSFITSYNTLVNKMDKLYNAASSKDYEPLTDEEKESLSDDEVEKWETKIKDALLRRDSTLNGVTQAMTMAMAKTYEIDGKEYSLSSFGISTMSYFTAAENEKHAFHIDGDADDSSTSNNQDKLKAAIATDPEKVSSFFSQLVKGLYSALDDKMKKTELSSAYTVYNDKELDKEYTNYTKLIDKWEDKIQYYEDYYYSKFTAMEKALAKLNSNSSSLAGLLGTGN
ncbi:flagellar hook-associated protein 2 [Acetitomaculum ruminis DSM 5522]|uniref:Flagellar hook-associated protein 2 n=1 Tax=Acetitomaculum ruminis DSM 5522 TaxID=1120918 RepID=A0A1I0WL26_9FIRM|nr:flagellar filament capping protein FliD [Acetitomaculum ruminis]SFA88656.1 flagellar hook-associated protein 2 [Acetitomaculum ruminis DSM 5522]